MSLTWNARQTETYGLNALESASGQVESNDIPPTRMVDPDLMSLTAASAELQTFDLFEADPSVCTLYNLASVKALILRAGDVLGRRRNRPNM